jgi:hypothetical protein
VAGIPDIGHGSQIRSGAGRGAIDCGDIRQLSNAVVPVVRWMVYRRLLRSAGCWNGLRCIEFQRPAGEISSNAECPVTRARHDNGAFVFIARRVGKWVQPMIEHLLPRLGPILRATLRYDCDSVIVNLVEQRQLVQTSPLSRMTGRRNRIRKRRRWLRRARR